MPQSMKYALLLLVGCAPCIMPGQFDDLKKLTAYSGHYSEAEAQTVAIELFRPLTPDRGAVQTLAEWLARKQLDWQEGRIQALDSAKLLASVNRELGLQNSAALQLREDEIQKTRAFLKAQVPGLIGDVPAGQMSPFDAFLSVEWLVRLKMAGAPIPAPIPLPSGRPVRATLTARPYNPRDHQFAIKVMQAWKKWTTVTAGQQTLEKVLAETQ
jgi:hypothetical protein